MAEIVKNDNKHKKILVLCFLCLGVYVYLYANVNVNLEKIGHIHRSALRQLSHVLHRREDGNNTVAASRRSEFKGADVPGPSSTLQEWDASRRLLTVFTSWSKSGTTALLRNNTALNWRKLWPCLYPVLFTNDTELARNVQKHGWDSLPILHTEVNMPVLKHMYLTAMKLYWSPLYAFVNGDILFTQSLVETLMKILQSELYNRSAVLVVGRRTNLINVTRMLATNEVDLTREAIKRGELFTPWGIDYFITSRSFPWGDMPDMVIGRIAYDNFLVVEAKKRNVTTIDATKTVLAVHQTMTKGSEYKSHSQPHNSDFNLKLLAKIYKKINYAAGTTNGARYFTKYDYKSEVSIVRR
ncbi:uncharacterized protein LOC111132127 isoform X2 [Crassostrea virginica]